MLIPKKILKTKFDPNIYTKTHQIAPFFFVGACPRAPLAKRMANMQISKSEKNISWHPGACQILGTPLSCDNDS